MAVFCAFSLLTFLAGHICRDKFDAWPAMVRSLGVRPRPRVPALWRISGSKTALQTTA